MIDQSLNRKNRKHAILLERDETLISRIVLLRKVNWFLSAISYSLEIIFQERPSDITKLLTRTNFSSTR